MKACLISDTHNLLNKLYLDEDIDLLIHAGDFTNSGGPKELEKLLKDMFSIKAKQKICVLGNHDANILNTSGLKTLFKNFGIDLLINDTIVIEGLKIHGVSWFETFWHKPRDYKFSEKSLRDIYDKIPKDIDILLTHQPPYGILDLAHASFSSKERLGCTIIKDYIAEFENLKYHFFGHVHEESGILEQAGITYINCALMSEDYTSLGKAKYLELVCK